MHGPSLGLGTFGHAPSHAVIVAKALVLALSGNLVWTEAMMCSQARLPSFEPESTHAMPLATCLPDIRRYAR